MNNLNSRNKCCICRGINLHDKLTIANFPVYMGVTDSSKNLDLFSNQTWVECQSCGCLQLKELLPLNLIYQSNHSTEVVGKVWRDHHGAFSEFIAQHKPSNILEIGAAHGYLATTLIQMLPNSKYTIIEPDSSLINARIEIIRGFIEDNFSEISGKDCIIHSHVLEHIYEPVEFIKQISTYADIGCEMYVSFPNFHGLIEGGALNSLNFEHTYLLDARHAELIFKNSGFSVLESTNYLFHSHFYRLKKVSKIVGSEWQFPNVSSQSRKFLEMVDSLKKFVESANSVIENHAGPVYVFGAHVFSQALLAFGLNKTKIVGILDNSSDKQNKRLYGTNYKVFSPSVIENQDEVMVILKASHYQDEIRSQLKLLNSHAIVLEN
jgi:2-polyprenyl-3-methyl-5-hydroxy-6-metoxy-1,4-benzoquinol methylase